jgi:hypothetical protein
MIKKTVLGLAVAALTIGAVMVPKPAEAYWVRGYGWGWHAPYVVVRPAYGYGPVRYWAPGHYWVRPHYTPWGAFVPGHWN